MWRVSRSIRDNSYQLALVSIPATKKKPNVGGDMRLRMTYRTVRFKYDFNYTFFLSMVLDHFTVKSFLQYSVR